MLQYAEKFDDRGDIRWLPYLMYFHPTDHRSEVVNTDALGFRLSHGADGHASAGGRVPDGPVRLIAGSSTVFGIGASRDEATLASRLWTEHAPSTPWLNFGGRSHNSTQELMLFLLYRHLVPQVEEIVLFSGFNNLGLARLPESKRGDHGGFFNSAEFFEAIDDLRAKGRKSAFSRLRSRPAPAPEPVPELDEQIAIAVDLTLRHLDIWRLLAQATGAKLTYVLQPLATWVREEHAPQERALFAELDAISDFGRAYGDIAAMSSGRRYAAGLAEGCARLGVPFVDLNPVLADAVGPRDWVFVDRIHFTDEGHDLVSGLLAKHVLGLSN
ncbi:SGNH/GDSL hydrolase family protein [Saccharothrix algeriensis]|uniref:SGNH/GDSL hydrolase family protein n=1 Tax=Saccharothrix algeriensis TaxID=173560 RepID=A0A8T8HZT0_9PSEU|nr:SGNH/GDSL hydrolase family protein [Saccharothrix algeriensis]MBM7809819.1 hypothetical protein [Saccharothrix algeriensis]QTR04095.1 SGNH/GDSL hydrolase family protein [Saccharothrix algeriensis]